MQCISAYTRTPDYAPVLLTDLSDILKVCIGTIPQSVETWSTMPDHAKQPQD